MQAHNVLLLFSNSPYFEQNYIAKSISKCLEEANYKVTILNTNTFVSDTMLQSTILQLSPDLIFTLGLSGFHLQLLGDDLFLNGTYCPCVHLLMRHPAYDSLFLSQRMNFTMYFYSHYKEYQNYIKHYYKRIPNIDTLPFYSIAPPTRIPFEKRKIDLFYPCSYNPSEDIMKHIQSLPAVFFTICNNVINISQKQPLIPIHECLKTYLNSINFICSDNEFHDIMQTMLLVELYIKNSFSEHYIKLLLKNGFSVTVSGENWGLFSEKHHPNFHILGEHGIPFEEVLNTMCNSKVILNLQFHKNSGIHPRLISACSCDANCVTNANKEIQKSSNISPHIFIFENDEDFLHQINSAINTAHIDNTAHTTFSDIILSMIEMI